MPAYLQTMFCNSISSEIRGMRMSRRLCLRCRKVGTTVGGGIIKEAMRRSCRGERCSWVVVAPEWRICD